MSILITFFVFCLVSLSSQEPTNTLEELQISLKLKEADYFSYLYEDGSIYYFDKVLATSGANDICKIHKPGYNLDQSFDKQHDSKYLIITKNRILFFDSLNIKIDQVDENDGILGFQTITSQPFELSSSGNSNLGADFYERHLYFDSLNNRLFHLKQRDLFVYNTNGRTFEKIRTIKLPMDINFKDYDIAYLDPQYLFVHNKQSHNVESYMITDDTIISIDEDYPGVLFMKGDTNTVFLIKQQEVLIKNKNQEFRAVMNSKPLHAYLGTHLQLYIYSENSQTHGGEIYLINAGDPIPKAKKVLTCPGGVLSMYTTPRNLYLEYDNLIRIHPFIGGNTLSADVYQESVSRRPLQETISGYYHDYLVFLSSNRIEYQMLQKVMARIECKKNKETRFDDHLFQVKIITTECDAANGIVAKASNGSCIFTQNILVKRAQDNFWIILSATGVLGFFLGFIVSFGFRKNSSKQVPAPETPDKRKKRPYNRNHSTSNILSRSITTTDTKKFLGEDGEETVPSEEFRMVMNTHENQEKQHPPVRSLGHNRTNSGGTFETPRFNFAGGALYELKKNQGNNQQMSESIEEVPPSEENRTTKRNDDSFAEN